MSDRNHHGPVIVDPVDDAERETRHQPATMSIVEIGGAKHLCFGSAKEAEAGALRAWHVVLQSANARLSSR